MAAAESMATVHTTNSRRKRKPGGDEETAEVVDSKRSKVVEEEDKGDEEEAKKITVFTVAEFRAALNTVDGLKHLRNFANCAEWKTTENDVVLEYLQSGGNISEISSLLDVTAQGDLATALPVFRATYYILVKIQAEAKEYETDARRSIDNLISTYIPTFEAMINLNSTKHRKIVFKLLSAIVTFHSSYGRQVLNWFSLTPQQVEQLTEPGALRRAFVMFLVSFFVTGKLSLFRPFIEKKGYLMSIIPNLKFDDAKTVAVVLSVLKDKLLANPAVTKTQKLHIFNTQIIQSLFQLFEWVGPKGARKGWKKPKKLSAVDEESLALVTNALQEFLLVLCACRKNGIIFHDKSLGSGQLMNPLVLTALGVLPKPWKKPETSKLVLRILDESPDLIKYCLTKWEASFEARESPAWTTAIVFLIKIIKSLQMESILGQASDVLSAQQLQNVLKAILLSPSIVKHLSAALSQEKSVSIRTHGLQVLTTIIEKLNEFPEKYEPIRKNLKQVLRNLIPSASWICEMWKVSDSFKIISDFLLSLAKLELTFLDNPRRVCKTLIKGIEEKDADVQSAVLQTISLMDPTFLSPNSEQFEEALGILLRLAWNEKPAGGAISALSRMLINTRLWDGSLKSLDCWIGAWFTVPEENLKSVSTIFVQAVKQAAVNDQSILHVIQETETKEDFENYLQDVLLHLGCVTVSPDFKFGLDFDSLRSKKFKSSLKANKSESNFIFWLYGSDNLDVSLQDASVFSLDRFFAFTLQILKFWISSGNFDADRQKRAQESLEIIFQMIPVSSRKPGKALISADPCFCTLFNKSISHLFSDKLFLDQYHVDKDSAFTAWLKDLLVSTKIAKNAVNGEYLKEMKAVFLTQLTGIAIGDREFISADLDFWTAFLEPSVAELNSIFDHLCAQTTDDVLDRCDCVWLSAVRAIKSQPISKDLGLKLVRHLCRVVTTLPRYSEALLELISNQPLLVMDVPKSFLKSILELPEIDDSLVKACECCVAVNTHKTVFLKAVASGGFNGRTALALLGQVLKYPGGTGALRHAVSYPRTSVPPKFSKILTAVARAAKDVLKKYTRGQDDSLLDRHLDTVLLAIKELGKKDKRANSFIKGLKGESPRLEVFPILTSFANRLQPDSVLPWIQSLIVSPKTGESWEKKSHVIQELIRDDGNLKAFVGLRQTKNWIGFVNSMLRGIGINCDPHRIAVLRAVTSVTWSEGADNKDLEEIFHRCTSHSEFLTIMLSNSSVKAEIVGLIFEIIRFWPNVMMIGHVPVYLAAYNASLSSCDQQLLEILRRYESHCGSLSKFEPLFWGQQAIEHYSLKGTFGVSLWKQVTMKSVLALIDAEKMKRSTLNFPINRKLQENSVPADDSVYDPAFFLPLFSNLFSPGAVSYCLNFISHGALSYSISALSSNDPDVRGAAAVVLSRFYSHLQLSQYSKQKPIWLHIIDCVRYGLEDLSTAPIPGIVTLFLARAVTELSDSSSSLNVLHKYLLAKPSFDLTSLTEFMRLFYSEDPDNLVHRKWILEVIRDGIRQAADVRVITKRPVLKMLLSSFSSVSNEHKILILEIVERILRVRASPKIVFDEYGLLSWIRNITTFIHGPLLRPYLAVLQSSTQYLLCMEEKNGNVARIVNNMARLETAIVQASHKTANLDEVVKYLTIVANDAK